MRYSVSSRRHHKRRGPLRRYLFMGLAVISVAVAGYLIFLGARPTPPPAQHASVKKVLPVPKVTDGALQTRILFVGDVMWGRTIQTKAEKSRLGYEYPTSGLTKADRASYDAWIANFECPITTQDVPLSLQIDILKFNCRPEYLPNLAKWFTAASQANNHTMNVDGQWGIEQTRGNLEKAGIQHFGNYDMNKLDDICEVVTIPATTATTHKSVSLPIALCGYMQVVDVPPSAEQLAVMRKYAEVMPVIAMPHMGVEFRSTAEPAKVTAYHQMIDNGADAVIAAHPHVIQNSEAYKGRLIAYSLGNFLFDQQSLGLDTSIGLGVGIKLTIADDAAARIYQAIAPSCRTYRDNCLAQLSARLTKRPAISVSYNFVCYDESRTAGNVPRLGSQQTCDKARQTATVERLTGLAAQW